MMLKYNIGQFLCCLVGFHGNLVFSTCYLVTTRSLLYVVTKTCFPSRCSTTDVWLWLSALMSQYHSRTESTFCFYLLFRAKSQTACLECLLFGRFLSVWIHNRIEVLRKRPQFIKLEIRAIRTTYSTVLVHEPKRMLHISRSSCSFL
jgi:hypothetical protein